MSWPGSGPPFVCSIAMFDESLTNAKHTQMPGSYSHSNPTEQVLLSPFYRRRSRGPETNGSSKVTGPQSGRVQTETRITPQTTSTRE